MSEEKEKSTSGSEKVDEIVKEKKQSKTQPKKNSGLKSKSTTQKKKNGLEKATIQPTPKSEIKKEETQEENRKTKVLKEKKNAKTREEIAKLKAEKKEKKAQIKQEKLQAKLKKREEKEAKIAEIKRKRLEKKSELEKRKAESVNDKKEKKATSKQRTEKSEKKKERNGQQNLGFWITAVCVLGATTLAMTTLFAVNKIETGNWKDAVGSTYSSSMYELTGLTENMNNDLSKLRVSNSPEMQRGILTDIIIQSQLSMSSLEKMPISMMYTQTMSAFMNNVNTEARILLDKVNRGESMTSEEFEVVEYMYNTNLKIQNELNVLSNHISNEEISKVLKEDMQSEVYTNLERLQKEVVETPSTLSGSIFSGEKQVSKMKGLENLQEVSVEKALQNCNEFLKEHNLSNLTYQGETVTESLTCYNFNCQDDMGRSVFAQVTKNGGKLMFFNMYEECQNSNLDVNVCVQKGKEFLSAIGIDNVKEVWINESGNDCQIDYAYVQEGVVVYTDVIKVNVCKESGKVIGIDAIAYYLNHHTRENITPTITMDEAKANLSNKISSQATGLCYIPVGNEEVLAYEFVCQYQDTTYFIYIDAKDGKEVKIAQVMPTSQGSLLV